MVYEVPRSQSEYTTISAITSSAHSSPGVDASPSIFADDLVACIKGLAQDIADTAKTWSDHCATPMRKYTIQAGLLGKWLDPLYAEYGLAAASWCATYNVQDKFSGQPDDVYREAMCPPSRSQCIRGNPMRRFGEEFGVPAPSTLPRQKISRMKLYVMSCELCAFLRSRLGPPPYIVPRAPGIAELGAESPESAKRYSALFDLHAFGVWIGSSYLRTHPRAQFLARPDIYPWNELTESIMDIMKLFGNDWGPLHGFLWSNVASLVRTPTTLPAEQSPKRRAARRLLFQHEELELCCNHSDSGARPIHGSKQVQDFSYWGGMACATCATVHKYHSYSDACMACGHGLGHGLFYSFLGDLPMALNACWGDLITDPVSRVLKTREFSKMAWGEEEFLNFRWLCSGGVLHTAASTMTVPQLALAAKLNVSDTNLILCEPSMMAMYHQGPHFDNCAAALGVGECDARLALVKAGGCADYEPAPEERMDPAVYAHLEKLANEALKSGAQKTGGTIQADAFLRELWRTLR